MKVQFLRDYDGFTTGTVFEYIVFNQDIAERLVRDGIAKPFIEQPIKTATQDQTKVRKAVKR